MYSKTQKSLTLMLSLPAKNSTVFAHTKRKENRKTCVHAKPNTHNTSLTFYLTITATSYRTELALTYLPNLSSLLASQM